MNSNAAKIKNLRLCMIPLLYHAKANEKKTNFQFKKSFLFMNNKFSTNTIIVPKIKSQKSIFQSPSNETAIHVVTVTKNGNTLFIIQPKAHINSEKRL